MKFGTIASGSSGNCLYAGTEKTEILIDAGISCKRIVEGLEAFGTGGNRIKAIMITHEHSDHIQGLGVLSRKFHIPMYATDKTIQAIKGMKNLGKIDEDLFKPVVPGSRITIDDMDIQITSVSHDAADPVCYAVNDGSHKIGMVTDLGFYDQSILRHLDESDILYVEANHDIHMLQAGPYPYYLKRRILGDHGHLCNEAAASLIKESLHKDLKRCILGHLSKENNYPDLALLTVQGEIAADIDVSVAPRDHAGQIFEL